MPTAKAKKKLDAHATPRSIRDVTRFLAQHRVEGVSLERGRGFFFFFFVGVPVHNWLNRTVVTPDLGGRTLGQWLEEYRWLAGQNASRDPFAVGKPSRRKHAARR